jgi:DNA-binding MurR/RpiR family transcriptional regulator
MMGFSVRVVTTDGMPLTLELSALRPTDLLIGISFWRYLRGTVKAMYKAKEIGATRIAITDSELSPLPLARLADYPFLVATEGTAHNLSPVAPISLINAFVAALSLEVQDQALHAWQQVNAS